jgi:hypothetical protein
LSGASYDVLLVIISIISHPDHTVLKTHKIMVKFNVTSLETLTMIGAWWIHATEPFLPGPALLDLVNLGGDPVIKPKSNHGI